MITEKELRQRLKAAVAGNISRWARENKLSSQRGNISLMICGERDITAKVGRVLGYKKVKGWEKD